MGLAVEGGGTLVSTPQLPPVMTLFVSTEFVKPTTGTKVNWNKLPFLTGAVIVGGLGLVMTRFAMELVTLPALLVMTTL